MILPAWIHDWIQQEDEELMYTVQEQNAPEPFFITWQGIVQGYEVRRVPDTTWLQRFEPDQDRDAHDTTV